MTRYMESCLVVLLAPLVVVGCGGRQSEVMTQLANPVVSYTTNVFYLRQELINDAPIGPGDPQASDHCPTEPGNWFAGSGRSTATSSVFGDLTGVEVYCINVDRAELSGGLSTWTDIDGDTVLMNFGAKLLEGFAYEVAPGAPMIGFAQLSSGTGKWAGITGNAFMTGKQNGDGTATLDFRGTVYLPK